MSTKRMVIGIIGGGVSGLGAAYELRKNAMLEKHAVDIHIFERQPELGGNADTVVVNLGNEKSSGKPFHRWADLGVNDINLTAYLRIRKVMQEIGYYDWENPGKDPKLMPLENTETYFTWDSSIVLSGDADLEHGVSDETFTIEGKDEGDFSRWIDIIHKLADQTVGTGSNKNIDMTVEQFFESVINDTECYFASIISKSNNYFFNSIDWSDEHLSNKRKKMLTEIRDYIFYPRISAMYFTNDYGPEKMCLAAPICYYRTQESRSGNGDTAEPDRRYFVGGSNGWLVKLKQNLCDSRLSNDLVNIEFHADYQAEVLLYPKQIIIHDKSHTDCKSLQVDHCVITVHADDAEKLLSYQYNDAENNNNTGLLMLRQHKTNILQILQSITYTSSIAVCHTYAGLLPANRNQWRTYNVLIRQGFSLKPYSMTYVCNRHQNDAGSDMDSGFDKAGLPQFFVTLNPLREIPEQYVLKAVASNDMSSELKSMLPRLISASGSANSNSADVKNAENYGRLKAGEPAVAYFKHNLIDKNCFQAQQKLIEYHHFIRDHADVAKQLYFGGGWSNGSGLHEECWEQAERIAECIIPLKCESRSEEHAASIPASLSPA